MKTRRWLGLLVLLGVLMVMASCEGSQSPQEPPFIGTVLEVQLDTVLQVNSGVDTIIEFSVVQVDEFSAYNTSTWVYTVPQPGDYNVSYGIEMKETYGAGDPINYNVNVESASGTTPYSELTSAPGGNTRVYHTGSQSLTDLSAGDKVTFSMYHENTSTLPILLATEGIDETFLTIEKVK